MEMLGKVRRMHYRDELSRSEIARRTGLSRTTVRKWLEEAKAAEPRYRRTKAPSKLTAFEATVVGWLEADARRPKREHRTAQAMLMQLKAQGFEGSYPLSRREASGGIWFHFSASTVASCLFSQGCMACAQGTSRGSGVQSSYRVT